MSVLTFVEVAEGKVKKASLEAAAYASKIAESTGTESVAVVLGESGADELAALGKVGVKKVLHANDSRFNGFDSKLFAKVVAEAADKVGATLVVASFNQNGKLLAPRVAVRLQAGYVPGAGELPVFSGDTLTVKKSVFSGKASANYQISTAKKVLALTPNSFPIVKGEGNAAVEAFTPTVADADFTIKVKGVEKVTGTIPLTEAELVVSGGRGLKGPENWWMVENLATELGAATACSRAVADVDWRPRDRM